MEEYDRLSSWHSTNTVEDLIEHLCFHIVRLDFLILIFPFHSILDQLHRLSVVSRLNTEVYS